MNNSMDDIQKILDNFFESKLGKLTDEKANTLDNGFFIKNNKLGIFSDNNQNLGGHISAKKRWKENRDECLKNCKIAGQKCRDEQKGIFTLTKDNLSNQGKKGYNNGLGKLSKEEISKISSKAGLVNRNKNSKLKPDDIKYVREVFVPRHPKFGVVALSKKYNVSEGTMRSAIKGKSFKDID